MAFINSSGRKLAFLCFIIGCGTGCGTQPPSGPAPSITTTSRPVSLISPVEFFPPEQKRLSQHLNWNVGCFKVEYAGPKAWIGSRVEVWTDGKPAPANGFSTSQAGIGEVSISVRPEPGNHKAYYVTQVQSTNSGSSSTSGGYQRPELGSSSTRVAKIQNPLELKRGEEVAVWALMSFKSRPGQDHVSRPDEPVLEQVKRSDWALVLRVALDPPDR